MLRGMCYFPHVNSEEIKIQKGHGPHPGSSVVLDTKDWQWRGPGGNEHNNIINSFIYNLDTKQLCREL